MAKKDRTGNRKTRDQRKQFKVPEFGRVYETKTGQKYSKYWHSSLDSANNKCYITYITNKTNGFHREGEMIMLMPSIFGDNLFDDFMNGFPFGGSRGESPLGGLMKTDIRDTSQGYELDIDMPGFKKEDIRAELKDGYLTIRAQTNGERDEKDDNGRYIRRERYSGSCQRSFYVGREVVQEDIRARFENGILKLTVPKKEALPRTEENRYIAIEG